MKTTIKQELVVQWLWLKYEIQDFLASLKDYIHRLYKVRFHNEHY